MILPHCDGNETVTSQYELFKKKVGFENDCLGDKCVTDFRKIFLFPEYSRKRFVLIRSIESNLVNIQYIHI